MWWLKLLTLWSLCPQELWISFHRGDDFYIQWEGIVTSIVCTKNDRNLTRVHKYYSKKSKEIHWTVWIGSYGRKLQKNDWWDLCSQKLQSSQWWASLFINLNPADRTRHQKEKRSAWKVSSWITRARKAFWAYQETMLGGGWENIRSTCSWSFEDRNYNRKKRRKKSKGFIVSWFKGTENERYCRSRYRISSRKIEQSQTNPTCFQSFRALVQCCSIPW